VFLDVCPILEAPHPGRQVKHALYKKTQYICRLIEERMTYVPQLTKEYMGHVAVARGGPICLVYSSMTCHR
jgi:hypothetical protein